MAWYGWLVALICTVNALILTFAVGRSMWERHQDKRAAKQFDSWFAKKHGIATGHTAKAGFLGARR